MKLLENKTVQILWSRYE